jgi:hypothetical protein
MAYTRTITQLIADVRTRTSTGGAVARHPDAEITRFLVESLQTLRAILTDAGSSRFVGTVSVDVDYVVSDIPGALGLQLVDSASAGANARQIESIQSVHVPYNGRMCELRRVSLPELVAIASRLTGASHPEVWADGGVETLEQPSVSGFFPAVRVVYMAPWSGGYNANPLGSAPLVLGTYGMESVSGTTDVCLEQYGFEWVIADAGLKVATRDNDAQETAQLLMAARADAEKRMLSTISRERSPVVQKRVASTIRRGRRTWET